MHPAIRLLHRILGYMVFNKQDLGKITAEEIRILWLATKPELGRRVNFGFLFTKCIEGILSGTEKGEIHCGGMVTRLAEK
jgi:hypothetical protein